METILLKYPFYKQTTDYTCGPACLKMVFKKHSVSRHEFTLARIAGTESKWGTQHQGMIDAALKHNFFSFVRRRGSISDLRDFVKKGYAVIVDWTEPIHMEGHYSLLIGFTKRHVIYHDPYWGRESRLKISKFIRLWYEDGSRSYGWMMVLGRHPIPTHLKGKHYYPKDSKPLR